MSIYSAFQVIELHHSLLPTPYSPSHLWSKYLKNAVSCIKAVLEPLTQRVR
ncbi:hypothetical protein [Nostoc sp. CHAB 5715]|uniref:hypothetical protein n=1 Tax=Nostoc sp. CHAB 5715 TaxID=2780400 RepID=UPI001E4C3F27|nr:hypothetical protein [Nostoc sp. CHAB 5715]MCC5624264.1 hypothetical protein [Nostoc sp. CHAB 5715]